jgi:hypothetical protein
MIQYVFNPFTGNLDAVNDNNGFSWFKIPTGVIVCIEDNREMITTSPQTIDGTLIVDGRNTVL